MNVRFLLSFFSLISMFSIGQVHQLQQASDKAERKLNLQPDDKPFSDKSANKVLNFVNPFIGTGGHGHTFPGPVMPFGMVQVGPDTRYEGWDGCSGYHYSDSIIYGFSHTHLSGTGVPDYSDVLLVPQQGKLNLIPGYRQKNGFGSSFNHANEVASPGYYRVKLNNGIQAELSATARCAIHRYTFSSTNEKHYVVIDLGYRDRILDVSATKKSSSSISGKRISKAWANKQSLYFHLETSVPFIKSKWIQDPKNGNYLYVLEFPKSEQVVLVKVGISGVDEVGAKQNLDAEIQSFLFQVVKSKAEAAWNKELSAIQLQSNDQEALTNFYSALYHAYIHPSLWSDVDGRYRDFNDQLKASKSDVYSVFSLWDTYRGAHPLYTITQTQRTQDFNQSFYYQFQNTRLLPMWPLSANETNCMIGYHAASVIADAYLKGIQLEDPKALLNAMVETAKAPILGRTDFTTNGFISANNEPESVSKTLEYAYDDWCIALMADEMGEQEIAREFYKRASNWMNVINPESHFFQPRKGGMFLPFFKPNEVNHHYTEANAWQYALACPQHIQSLIDMHGGSLQMEQFLDTLFLGNSAMTGRDQADISGLIGQYAHGNEPSHHMAYLYNYCGKPWKTQLFVDSIMQSFYSIDADGLCGNEDAGQMSAWYILSSMGFYPVAPGSLTYALGRPMFDQVVIAQGDRNFTINTINNSKENKYIQSISWNGHPYEKLYITHEMIRNGGILELKMGNQPNESLARYELDLRQEISADFVPVPYFTTSQTVFENQLSVAIEKMFFEKGEIYYSTDGKHYESYEHQGDKNILLNETTTLFAKVVRPNGTESHVVSNLFTKHVKDRRIKLQTVYANQYAGAGDQTLVDGQQGTDEYRGTEWQGFQGESVNGVIELNDTKELTKVTVSYLQDTRSWIFPPKAVVVELSLDGVSYKKIGRVTTKELNAETPNQTGALSVEFAPTLAKYIRFSVENYGPCPAWHLSPGGKTWLFLDEIEVK